MALTDNWLQWGLTEYYNYNKLYYAIIWCYGNTLYAYKFKMGTRAGVQTWGESTFNDSESDSGRLFDSESESSQFGYDSESDSDSSNISISDSDSESESDSDSNFQLLI